jgi:hypothetical protein
MAYNHKPRLHDNNFGHGTLNFGTQAKKKARLHSIFLFKPACHKNFRRHPIKYFWHPVVDRRCYISQRCMSLIPPFYCGKFKYGGHKQSRYTSIEASHHGLVYKKKKATS